MAVDGASSEWSVTIKAAGRYTQRSSFNFYSGQSILPQLKANFGLEIFCLCVDVIKIATCFTCKTWFELWLFFYTGFYCTSQLIPLHG